MNVTTLATNTLLVVVLFCTMLEDVRARSRNVKGVYFDENTSKLIPADNQVVQNLADLSDGVYSLELATTRSGCGSSGQEYLGFYNRTCSPSLSSKLTSGPVARGPSKSMMWREWMVRVGSNTASSSEQEDVTVLSLQAFVHPDVENDARCLGYVSIFYGNSEYKGTCVIPPYGNGLFLNSTSNDAGISSQTWTVVESDAGVFRLVASNKPSACLRYLGLQDCGSSAVLVDETSTFLEESSIYTTWKFIRRYDLVPLVSPPSTQTVFVTNSGDNTISACSISGSTLSCIDSGASGLSGPVEIAISGSTAFVTNFGGNTISACSISGSTLSCSDSGASELSIPVGIAISGSTVFVTNVGGNTISACSISGSTLSCIDSGASGLSSPSGIAISGSTAFVTNFGDTISACSISGSTLSCIDSGASGLSDPIGIAIS